MIPGNRFSRIRNSSFARLFSVRWTLVLMAVLAVLAAVTGAISNKATSDSAVPIWTINSGLRSPTIFIPGDSSGNAVYTVQVINVGSGATSGPITVTDLLPPGLTIHPKPSAEVSGLEDPVVFDDGSHDFPCEPGPPVTCVAPIVVHPGERLTLRVPVNVAPNASPIVVNQVAVSGGGAGGVVAREPTAISSTPAGFGVQSFDTLLLDGSGGAETRAGSHPYQMRIGGQFNTVLAATEAPPAENPKDLHVDLPAGLIINPQATPTRCSEAQFETINPINSSPSCPAASAVGIVRATVGISGAASANLTSPLFNLVPPPGTPASFGFNVAGLGINVHLLGHVRSDGDYGLSSATADIPQYASFSGFSVDLWGDPSDPSHDFRRGVCGGISTVGNSLFAGGCPVAPFNTPLITMPSACSGPLVTTMSANSWQHRERFVSASAETKTLADEPVGVTGCGKLSYNPDLESNLFTGRAESASGLDVDVNFPNNGLSEKDALAESNTQKVVVTLPEGVTVNPSAGEGLAACTPVQYKRETVDSAPGEGCPNDSRVGTLHLETPLVNEGLDGSVYLAQPDDPRTAEPGAENPFDSLVALYFVLKNPFLGVIVKQPLKVELDPNTGQLVSTLDNIPQLPFSHFSFHFREGSRAPLVTPSKCGKYTTVAKFYPSSDPSSPRTVTSSFEITEGVNGGPCPSGTPPFHPRFDAGSVNNNAKTFSPFDIRVQRSDGEQELTKVGAILPFGVLGKVDGVGKCSDAAINTAQGKTGLQELASPSCPSNSLIGHILGGAGVGEALTYVPGQLYLAGSYQGDPLSIVAITPAVAGPFDAGTVVVRVPLTLNPLTAEVEVDGSKSDSLPRILKGIPLRIRDLRVNSDRNSFMLNPTNCDVSSTRGVLFGANTNLFDSGDDVGVQPGSRYQAANCLNLAFKPSLSLRLKGGTKRNKFPALRAVVGYRASDANLKKAVVTLPHSAFLEQAHIRTICTRVQFAAGAGNGAGCPAASVYGRATAYTPLLEEPLKGPVYLRSSSHKLPDLVLALHGLFDVNVIGRIDSHNAGIRTSFENLPDAPLSKVVLDMQGGKKGLIVNSRNLCAKNSFAEAAFDGQNGRYVDLKPKVKASCKGKKAKKNKKAKRGAKRRG